MVQQGLGQLELGTEWWAIADLLLEVVTHLAPAQTPDRLLVFLICCMLPHPNKSRNDKIKLRTMQLFSGAANHGTVDHAVVAKLGVEHAASSQSCFVFTRRSIAQFSTFQTQCVQSRVFQLSRVASFCPEGGHVPAYTRHDWR